MHKKIILVRPPRLQNDRFQKYIVDEDNRKIPIHVDLPDNNLVELIKLYYEKKGHDKNSILTLPIRATGSQSISAADLLDDMEYKPGQLGLWDYQIKKAMERFPNFVDVITADEVSSLPAKPIMGFIMNLDKRSEPGSHWVACYIDTVNDKSVEYYNSFADGPTEDFMTQLNKLIGKINPPTYLKFKVNHIVEQKSTTDTCGFFAMKFLIDRFSGIPFRECTKYNDTIKGEEKIKKFRQKFGYI